MRIHRLKTLAPYWERIQQGDKTFEIRKNDRDFQVGDILELELIENKHDPVMSYSMPPMIIKARVKYLFSGGQYGLEIGYCIMSIELI